jgi:hypothetical protein
MDLAANGSTNAGKSQAPAGGNRSGGGGNGGRAVASAATPSPGPSRRQSAPARSTASFVSESAGSAPEAAPKRLNASRSDVDGSRWKGRRSESDILALMSEKEDNGGGGIAFGAGLGLDADDDEGSDHLDGLDDDDDLGGLIDDEGEPGQDAPELDDEEPIADEDAPEEEPETDPDDFESELNVDQAKLAAKFLLDNGADRNEIKALLQHSPGLLVSLARQQMTARQGGQGQTGQPGQAGAGKTPDAFDSALDEILAPAIKELSSQFDTGDDTTATRAITEPVRLGIRFLGDKVAQRFHQVDQLINQIGAAVEEMQISHAREVLANDYPTITNDKMFERVRARMGKMKGSGHKTMRELMADAAQRELGTLTAAQRRVQETRSRQQRAISTSAEGVGAASGGKKAITRDQHAEVLHALIERGMSAEERTEYMRSRYTIAKPKGKGG